MTTPRIQQFQAATMARLIAQKLARQYGVIPYVRAVEKRTGHAVWPVDGLRRLIEGAAK